METTLDKECNRLFRELDKLRAELPESDAEYLRVLYELRDKTRARVEEVQS